MVLLDIYRRLLLGLRYERHIMIFFITLISVTWVVVIIVIFVECHPVHLYWQVIPDSGKPPPFHSSYIGAYSPRDLH